MMPQAVLLCPLPRLPWVLRLSLEASKLCWVHARPRGSNTAVCTQHARKLPDEVGILTGAPHMNEASLHPSQCTSPLLGTAPPLPCRTGRDTA